MQQTLGDISDQFGKTPDEMSNVSVVDISESDLNMSHIKTLAPYLAIAETIKDADKFTAPIMLGKLSQGMRLAGDYLAVAKYNYKRARYDRKRIEAVVALDKFPEYAVTTQIKVTDALRGYYVNQHPDVLKAVDREAFFEAIQEQLYTMKTELFMAITTVRSIVYGFKDSNNLSATATPAVDD